MTQYAHSGPAWVEIFGGFTLGEGEDAMGYPADWPLRASPEQREAAGVAEIVDDSTTPPDGKAFAGFAAQLADADGQPRRVANFIDVTAPTQISMLQLELEFLARDQHDDLLAAIAASGPQADVYFRREADVTSTHPMMLIVQQHLGWTDEQRDEFAISAQLQPAA